MGGALLVMLMIAAPNVVLAQITAFEQAVAEAASDDPDLSAYYRRSGYDPLWVGGDAEGRDRRAALLVALDEATIHGLPATRYDAGMVRAIMAAAQSERDRGRVEVELSRLFLRFARDLQTGILTPSDVVPGIKRDVLLRDRADLLAAFARARPNTFLNALPPQSTEYTRLVGEKLKLEDRIALGGWGAPVQGTRLEFGDTGREVVILRDRLMAIGYLQRSAAMVFDQEIREAVMAFQADHGLRADGIVGGETLSELNRTTTERLGQIMVAMERERWLNRELGRRHVWVNLTDFTAKIIEDGEVRFETRAVIGKNADGRETPEFSDMMEHMVVNPSWYVPRSIVVEEYLPVLRKNPYALGQFEITDRSGRKVDRARGFARYTADNFPFSMRQPPSEDNALGRVKFMFPNRYAIYLHDTPAESLFDQPVRAYSHGCIRLNDPFEFAYALLKPQTHDPRGMFQSYLRTGRETRVALDDPLPVHLVYRTAISKPEGGMEYRSDIYGRDALILKALQRAGVALPGAGS